MGKRRGAEASWPRSVGLFWVLCTRGVGVGSDLDLLAVVAESPDAFERRNLSWSFTTLPVPSDLLVYTLAEWESLEKGGGRFARTLSRETVWVYVKK